MTTTHWAIVAPGYKVNLAAPDFTPIPWPVIARQLCSIPRFNGAFGRDFTIAGHSLHVAATLPPHLRLYGLLHDARETAMGDVIRPTRRVLKVHWQNSSDTPLEADPIEQLEMRAQIALFAKAGLQWPSVPADMALIQKADDAVCACELEHGMAGTLHTHLKRDYRDPHPLTFEQHLTTALRAHWKEATA